VFEGKTHTRREEGCGGIKEEEDEEEEDQKEVGGGNKGGHWEAGNAMMASCGW